MFLSHGIVGSMNGRGVFSSKKMGRFIATLEPRLSLVFAAMVLDWDKRHTSFSHVMGLREARPDLRKAHMITVDLLR